MSQITRTYSFTDGTTAYGSQVESEISNIVTVWNNHDAGSSNWTTFGLAGNATIGGTLGVTGNSTIGGTLGVTGASTFSGGVAGATTFSGAITATGGVVNLFGYRRPNLVFVSTTAVDVENNTGTANQTTIVFPDGTVRSVTEDTASTHKYRRFVITAAAEFTTGTEDSGIRAGISEATNTWYAIYAVKSAINTANFVLAGDTTLPLQANFSALNTRYGTSGWVYLGMIRNGNNDTATGDLLVFYQNDGHSIFSNPFTATSSGRTARGINLAAAAGGSAVTYTYTAGTGAANIPNHIKMVYYAGYSDSALTAAVADKDNTMFYEEFTVAISLPILSASLGLLINDVGARNITLTGWIDPILSSAYSVL